MSYIVHPHRRSYVVHLSYRPVDLKLLAHQHLVAVLHDLSHQKEFAQEEQQTTRLAQLSVIAAGLAHEIRNPLAGIRGATQLLQGRIRDDGGRELQRGR